MLNIKEFLPLGVFTRTHGVQGGLVLHLQAVKAEDLPEMEWVFVEVDGLPVPFLVNDIRELNTDKIIMSMDMVATELRAKALVGCRILIPSKKHAKKERFDTGLPNIKGFTVIDKTYGELGKAVEIIDVTGNPLLRIISDDKELLIPAHPDIVLEISEKKRRIRIKAPEGLVEL
jgi:16S rRNA processing protein RimM